MLRPTHAIPALLATGVLFLILPDNAHAQDVSECGFEPEAGVEEASDVSLSPEEAARIYECLQPTIFETYAAAGLDVADAYHDWPKFAEAPYPSGTHGWRYVLNYAAPDVAEQYGRFEAAGEMPSSAVLAKDSFMAKPDGSVAIGPLFLMEKLDEGASPDTGDWLYRLVQPDGKVNESGQIQGFCAGCHLETAEVDSMLFVPEGLRINATE